MLPPSTPDLIALDLLDSIAELGSLGRAASRHRMSQPAVSMRMTQLERRLGLTLLQRSPTGARLTPAGERVVALSRRVLHLMEASRNTLLVPVEAARSVAEFTDMVSAAARAAQPGEWILTSIGWHESNLAENRVPTLAELDAAAPGHPVLARRGGHFAVVNSAALRAAGIGPDTAGPPGGKIGRLADGSRDGVLEGGAVYQVAAFAPGPGRAELAGALGAGSSAYAALGVGTIREAMTTVDELLVYQDAADQDLLRVRVRPMLRVGSELTEEAAIALIDGLGARSVVMFSLGVWIALVFHADSHPRWRQRTAPAPQTAPATHDSRVPARSPRRPHPAGTMRRVPVSPAHR